MTPEKREIANELAKEIFEFVRPFINYDEEFVAGSLRFFIEKKFTKLIVVDKEEFKKHIKVTKREFKDKFRGNNEYVEYKASLHAAQILEKVRVEHFPEEYVEKEIKEMFTYAIEQPQYIK